MKKLSADHNGITDISELANLTQLETLYLRSNAISDISALQFMPNLSSLELNDNLISDLSPLAPLSQLIHIAFYNNQINTVTPIQPLVQLERLYLVGNNLDNADLPDFYGFDNLTGLELRENPGITSAAAMRALGDSLDQMTCEQIIWDGVCSDGLNLPPNPEIQSVTPNPANVWEVVTVQATAVDPETQNVKMQIDWGDGVISDYPSSYQTSGSTFYFSKTYTFQGTYEIRVRAKDTGDNESAWSDATEIEIYRFNHEPEGVILSAIPNPVSMNHPITVQVMASDQDDDSVQVKLYWGDVSFDDYSALAPNGSFFSFTHSYLGPGTYYVNAIVRDSYGLEGDWTETFQITVTAPNTAPVCQISSLTPSPAETGQTVTVRARATDPEGKTVRMQVDWGDGDQSGYTNYQSSGHIFEQTHVYSNLGTYSVRAAAQDYEGLTGPWCTPTPIIVNNSTNHAPRVQIENIAPETVSTGQPVTVKVMGIDFDNHQLQYQVDWGDGEIENFNEFSPSGTARYFRHIYWQAGKMTLKVRAKDERQMAGSWREGGPISISQGFNMPPQINNISDFRQINTQSYVIYLDQSATDDHNQPNELEWAITADATEVDIHIENRKVMISASFWEGTSQIFFEVTDQHGAPDTYSVEAEFFAPDRGDTLSIMSYDLSAFPLSDAENKTEALRLLIQSQNPTILVVQELGS
ncbi:leucine-rich repeat domain-containing protein, partial [bacterium]|nr:leucine-rich repeat domain-containing protein [bacterium]